MACMHTSNKQYSNLFGMSNLIKQNHQRGETSFDCFVKVRKIGFPFSFYSTRPFDAKTEKNGADIFEVTDVERRPRSNFLDHFHYSQAVSF